MKILKKTAVLLIAVSMIFILLPLNITFAAAKPDKPIITLEALKNDTAVQITIEKTIGAKGYKIVMKAPGETKYKKVKTLKKNGNTVRTYTVKGLNEGNYYFKVKAYTKSGSKTVYGSYSKAVSISLNTSSVVKGDVLINETNFPDENFRAYVKENLDLDGNGKLDEGEYNIEKLHIACKEIKDLKGIEFFTALTYLSCGGNQLTYLDVSKNFALEELDCTKSHLISLDVSGATALKYLYCEKNEQLISLDVSNNTALVILCCDHNQLTSLDVSKNIALEYLECDDNQLISLDVSGATALKDLICRNNQLTSLDVSKNIALEYLSCTHNQLTSIDVSKCDPQIKYNCDNNVIVIKRQKVSETLL